LVPKINFSVLSDVKKLVTFNSSSTLKQINQHWGCWKHKIEFWQWQITEKYCLSRTWPIRRYRCHKPQIFDEIFNCYFIFICLFVRKNLQVHPIRQKSSLTSLVPLP